MKTGLERVAEKARMCRNESFTSLLHHLTPELIRKHLNKMKTNTASGVDSVSLNEARAGFDMWVADAIASIHRKGYRAPAVRRVMIPKPGSDAGRPLGIPTIYDRALQGAVAEILSQIFEVDFLENSFGGRVGRSAHQAVISTQSMIASRRFNYAVSCDIENFFGSVSHEWVMRFLSHRVKDPRILNLILRWLRAGVMDRGTFHETELGVPQGGPISVLISNIYLHYALDLWLNVVVRRHLLHDMEFIRYLDDVVILVQDKADMHAVRKAVGQRLGKFMLSLNEEKTVNCNLSRRPMSGMRGSVNYLGFTLFVTRNRNRGFKIGIKTEAKRLHRTIMKVKQVIREGMHLPISVQHKRINMVLRGNFSYFGIGDNHRCLWAVRKATLLYWRKSLCRRSQKGRYRWCRFYRMLEFYPLCQVKLKIPYRDYKAYAIL